MAEAAKETSILFAIDSKPGSLQEILQIFKELGVNLTHIESRPSKTAKTKYDFFVTMAVDSVSATGVVRRLEQSTHIIAVLDHNPSTDNPNWFPRRIRDLDCFANRVLDAGDELEADHPGFQDAAYRARRNELAKLATTYRHGQPIPRVEYTADEVNTWSVIFRNLTSLHQTHACDEYNRAFALLVENCGYGAHQIPQLDDVSNFLHECTGFRLRPVPGLLSSRDFLAGLAFRVFHSTQYIRHSSVPMYTPEPDVVHELLGHVPLFADRSFAEFSQEIGLASLGVSDEDIKKLATCYWFTVEFGLCRQHNGLRAFGAGLLSSFGELQYCLTDKPEIRPFEPHRTGETEYPITQFQPVYFATESFDDAKRKLRTFARTLKRPFEVRYDAYTQSVEILDSYESLKNLTLRIQQDVAVLTQALEVRRV
eukprot:m.100215 g.100215  ORF g.100215 m.100215 type:complete len:425 (+) comp51460_c0_seq1:66-1340(+)